MRQHTAIITNRRDAVEPPPPLVQSTEQWGEWTDVDHGLDAAGDDPLFGRCIGNNRFNDPRIRTVDGQLMVRLGRHKTGRVLDGRTWDQFPSRAHAPRPEAAGGTR
jgi:hypothetical protein